MNPEVKAMWTAALRSGKYKQTESWLRTSDGFCCLGVLCDLYLQENPESGCQWEKLPGPYEFQYRDGEYFGEEGEFLPNPVRKWAGFVTIQDPELPPPKDPTIALSSLNDSGSSFEEIAQVIEETL